MIKIATLFVFSFLSTLPPAVASSALTRVNETKTLRCGYVEYLPALTRNFKTEQWEGFDYDIVQAVADRLQLSVEYTTPTGWATVVADLNADKFDMLCSGFWVHPNVGKFALFSRPSFYQPVFIVARADDNRFTPETNLNTPDLKMVALDGDNPVYIAKADFPEAERLILPNMTDFSQVLVNVATGKADFTIVDACTFGNYNKNNPDILKIIAPNNPIRTYPVSFVFGPEDNVLRDAVNAALDELILDGTINRIMDQYDIYPNSYYRVVIPYSHNYTN